MQVGQADESEWRERGRETGATAETVLAKEAARPLFQNIDFPYHYPATAIACSQPHLRFPIKMLRSALRCLCARSFAEDKLRPELVQKLIDMGTDYADARAFRHFTYKEMKEKISPELWAQITKDDPIQKYPELAEFMDLDDILPQNNPRLPPHLTKPAILLNDRQLQAQRMTIEFTKREGRIKQDQDSAVNSSQSVTSDGYAVHIGLVVAREPIWLTMSPQDLAFSKVRHKTWDAHNMYFVAEASLVDYEVSPDDTITEEMAIRRLIAKRNLDEGKPYPFVPDSIHYLDADPMDANPRSIANSGGNRVFLMFKDKITQKWVFPQKPAFGRRNLDTIKEEIRKELLLEQVKMHHLGPLPLFHVKSEAAATRTVTRPLSFDEKVYDLYFRRLKILFPSSSDAALERYMEIRYKMTRDSEPVEQVIKGSKTFFFQSVLLSGNVKKLPAQYEDWAWVPRAQVSRYVSREEFAVMAPVLSSY